MEAAVKMVKKLGGEIVGISFLIELSLLKGKDKLQGCEVRELVVY
jgi:adenine phosphoribosyltransferase